MKERNLMCQHTPPSAPTAIQSPPPKPFLSLPVNHPVQHTWDCQAL